MKGVGWTYLGSTCSFLFSVLHTDKQVIGVTERLFSMEADFFKALAHPARIRLIKCLAENKKCVCEFSEELNIEQSNISRHLSVLRKQGIVSFWRDGLKGIYKTNYPQAFEIIRLVDHWLMLHASKTFPLLDRS